MNSVHLISIGHPIRRAIIIFVGYPILFRSTVPVPVIVYGATFFIVSLVRIDVVDVIVLITIMSSQSGFCTVQGLMLIIHVERVSGRGLYEQHVNLSILVMHYHHFPGLSSSLAHGVLIIDRIFGLSYQFSRHLVANGHVLSRVIARQGLIYISMSLPVRRAVHSISPNVTLTSPSIFEGSTIDEGTITHLLVTGLYPIS